MYYAPVAARVNLTVLATAQVTKIQTRTNDDGAVTATGVAFWHGGKEYEVYSAKEVILCAGFVILNAWFLFFAC